MCYSTSYAHFKGKLYCHHGLYTKPLFLHKESPLIYYLLVTCGMQNVQLNKDNIQVIAYYNKYGNIVVRMRERAEL